MKQSKFKISFIILVCLFFLFGLTSASQYSAHGSSKTLLISGAFDWHPYLEIDEGNDSVSGLAHDILTGIGSDLGLEIRYAKPMPWKRVFIELEKGRIDVIAAAYWTQERSKKFIYSEAYLKDEILVWVAKGKEFSFTKIGDLQGYTGLIPLGASFGPEFDTFKKYLDIVENPVNKNSYIKMLLHGNADYFVSAKLDMTMYLSKSDQKGRVVSLSNPLGVNGVHFLFSKNQSSFP